MIPPSIRIFLCPQPIDMRLGFDRLAHLCRERLGLDPVDGGSLFIFVGHSKKRLKLLWFERNGMCLLYKRLHGAVFEVPLGEIGQISMRLDAAALGKLLAGVACAGHSRSHKDPVSAAPQIPS